MRAACQRCNHRKADHLLSELGWPTPEPVPVPTSRAWLIIGVATRDASWEPYLAAWSPDAVPA